MSHPLPRRTGRVVLALATLAVGGVADVGYAPVAGAADGDTCRPQGYDGDATVALDGPVRVGAPVTATFAPGTDWTADVAPGAVTTTWTGTGFGAPVRGRTFTARPDLVGAAGQVAVRVPNPRGRDLRFLCEVPRIDWGRIGAPGAPVVTGDRRLDGTLHVAPAAGDTVPAGASYHFQWFADGESRGTGEELRLAPTDVGAEVTVKAEVTARGFLDTAWSPAAGAGPIEGGELAAPSSVTVAGDAEVGATLSAVVTGAWTPGTTVSYAWEADGRPIGTDAESVVLTAAEVGARVRVVVTGTLTGYTSRSVTSPEVGPVVDVSTGPVVPGRPTISGVAQVGRTLTVAPATDDPAWPAGTTYAYEWLADGEPFATGPSVSLTAAQLGRTITVHAQVTRPGEAASPWSATSLSVGPVAAAGLQTPSGVRVTGRLRVGSSLTATSSGAWTPGTRLTYTWRADGVAFGTRTARVVLGAAQRGRSITVAVTGTLAGYAPATVISPATTRVAAGVLRATKPRIVGTAKVRHRLRAVTGAWTPGTHLTYRWYVDGRRIAGADGSRLRLTKAMRGHRITVEVTGRLAGYATRTRRSVASDRVR